MRGALAVVLLAMIAAPAWAQSKDKFTCGSFTAESWRTDKTSHWTIARGTEKTTESEVLRTGPRFECIEGAVLAVEFAPANGAAFLSVNFPDGSDVSYGGQSFERNGRFVLPIQARSRIPALYRAAFDYHCRFELPADPIPPDGRKDCVR